MSFKTIYITHHDFVVRINLIGIVGGTGKQGGKQGKEGKVGSGDIKLINAL